MSTRRRVPHLWCPIVEPERLWRKFASEPWPLPDFFTSSDSFRGVRQSCRADLRFMPSPSSSPRAPGNQTRWRILAPSKRIFKIRSTTLKRGSRATGKPGFYFVQSKHVGCISPRVCESNSLSKQSDFPKGWFLNNYVTHVLITNLLRWIY